MTSLRCETSRILSTLQYLILGLFFYSPIFNSGTVFVFNYGTVVFAKKIIAQMAHGTVPKRSGMPSRCIRFVFNIMDVFIRNDELCIRNDGLFMKNDEFRDAPATTTRRSYVLTYRYHSSRSQNHKVLNTMYFVRKTTDFVRKTTDFVRKTMDFVRKTMYFLLKLIIRGSRH